MGARTRRFTSLATGSNATKAAGIAALCAVMLLAACGGSGGSATEAGEPVIRGDVAATLTVTGIPASAVVGTTIVLTTVGGTSASPVSYATTSTGCAVTASSLTATAAGTCTVTATQGTQTGTAAFPFSPASAAVTSKVATVTFSTREGSGVMQAQKSSTPVALSANDFKSCCDQRVFIGWSVVAQNGLVGGKIDYTDRGMYSFESDVTLSAQWRWAGDPKDIVATATGPTSGSLSFQSISNRDGTPAVKGPYKLKLVRKMEGTGASTYWELVESRDVSSPGTYSFTVSPGRKYYFMVNDSFDSNIFTPPSVTATPATSSSTVSAPGTPPAPTVVAGTAKVTATVAAGTSGGTPATYTVKAYAVDGTVARTCTVTGSSGFCEVTPLTAGSTYTVKATAKNTAGDSGESGASSPVTVPATVPGAPGLTALSRRSKTEVWVTFSAPSSTGGKPITGYTVTATRNGVDVTQSFPAEAGRVSVGPLTRYAVYTFTVRAVNSVGTSNPSNASSFRVG